MGIDTPPSYPRSEIRPSNTLEEALLEVLPEASGITVEQEQALVTHLEQREAAVAGKELLEILEEYGIDPHMVEIRSDGRVRIEVRNHFSAKRLPEGYAYKGGAARALLLRSLGSVLQVEPRDIDIVRLTSDEPYEGADEAVAREFLPEDLAFGDGVEPLGSEDTYFATRDITLNEVLATDQEIIASEQCVIDVVRHIIRLTEYERTLDGEVSAPSQKMLAKVLRLYAESIHYYGEAEIANIPGWEFEQAFISPFWLALQLDRAFERSREVATLYVDELKKRRQIPQEIDSPEEAAGYLLHLIRGEFYYRHAPTEQFALEQRWMEEE